MSTENAGRIPPPFAVAMVLCEAIWRDPGSGKRFILGCFSTIGARSFPASHQALSVYMALTNGRGKVPFKLQLVDVDEELEPLFSAEGEIELDDPRMVGELDFTMRGVQFPRAGEYRMQFFACGEFIMERRLVVVQVGPPPEGEQT